MSLKRAILKAQLIARHGQNSFLSNNPATDMHEVFVTKGHVKNGTDQQKEAINHELNCALLTNIENMYITRKQNRELGFLLFERHGKETVLEWIRSLGLKTFNEGEWNMGFREYQNEAHATAQYPDIGTNYIYPVLGLAGEAGELANKVKKIFRDDEGEITADSYAALAGELGDVLWYLAEICTALGLDLETIAAANLRKLRLRHERNTIKGKGDNR